MTHGREFGFVLRAPAESVLFLECDRQGQVLWLSEGARAVLANPGNLVDAIPAGDPTGAIGLLRLTSVAYFFRLLERGDRVLLGVKVTQLEDAQNNHDTGLMRIQSNLLRHCFRLQHVERDLSTLARQRRRGGGRPSVVQIERERQRLGRELHTGVGQILAAIRLQLEIIGAQVPEPSPTVKDALGRISLLSNEALEQVRSVSRRLHPPEWQRLTLENALRQLWDLSGIPQRYEATLNIAALPHEPTLEVKVLMYRAAQEALSNLARHSQATKIDLSLHLIGESVVLKIQDNGVGFDVRRQFSAPPNVASGIGLRSIREQAASVGGKFVIDSSPSGTTLEVSAPFSRTLP
ncbi:MAG TPA: sensor histidine kinase [Bryobacteraceae bacterium]|nr:sensor histidine kinase [Bryobacteraceae bacterium]